MAKLTATYNGRTFKRSSERAYTHVVIIRDQGEDWKAVSWASRPDLAQKKVNEYTRAGREIKIIPVDTGA